MIKFRLISESLKSYFILAFGLLFFSSFIHAQTVSLDVAGVDFSFLNTNRTTLSGTPTSSGSVVKYANVLTTGGVTVYAKVTMTLDANVTISNYDDDTAKPGQFQPIINTSTGGIRGATYKMEFFDTATDFPIYLRNFILTGMDVDGNPINGSIPAYTELYRLSNQEYSAYRRSDATALTTSTVVSGSLFQILGAPTSINDTNFDNSNSFLADYNSSKTSITFFIGNTNPASGRLAAMKLGTAGGTFTGATTTTSNPTTKATTDLQILKSVNSSVALANTNVIFTLAATNLGAAAATGVQVGDLLPSGYTFVSASAPSGTTYNSTTGVWTIGNLAASASLNLQIIATVKATGNRTNVAIITGNEIDSNLTNNTASAIVTLADPCKFGAIPGTVTANDRDGDGINDVCDLDDDNDGISDINEGLVCSNFKFNFSKFELLSGSGTLSDLHVGDVILYKNGLTNGVVSRDLTITILGTSTELSDATEQIRVNPAGGLSIRGQAVENHWLEYRLSVVKTGSATLANPTGVPEILKNIVFSIDDIDSSSTSDDLSDVAGVKTASPSTATLGSYLMAGSFLGASKSPRPAGYDYYRLNPAIFPNVNDFTGEPDFTTTDQEFVTIDLAYDSFSGGDFMHGITGSDTKINTRAVSFALKGIICLGKDTDGDGIDDHLDLDSDNDGCLDAIEGDENVLNSQLVNAASGLSVGTGSTAANQNLCTSSTCVDSQGVPIVVNSGGTADIGSDQGQGVGSSANAAINTCICYNDPNTATVGVDTKHGITLLERAGADNSNWPMIRKSAHTALESNTKGFVITRVAGTTGITTPQEGMMVYDTVAKCLKLYDGTAWSCFNTPACP